MRLENPHATPAWVRVENNSRLVCGRALTAHGGEIGRFRAFFAQAMLRLFRACSRPRRIRWAEVRDNVYAAGCGATRRFSKIAGGLSVTSSSTVSPN